MAEWKWKPPPPIGRVLPLWGTAVDDTPSPYSPGPPPARRGQETQAAGAAAIAPEARRIRGMVLYHIAGRGAEGATNEEIAVALHLRLQTVCGRVNELQGTGQVVDSGRRRAGASGVPAKVWVTV